MIGSEASATRRQPPCERKKLERAKAKAEKANRPEASYACRMDKKRRNAIRRADRTGDAVKE